MPYADHQTRTHLRRGKGGCLEFLGLLLGAPLLIGLGPVSYIVLDDFWGAGGNTDGTATAQEEYYSSLAPTVAWIFVACGLVLATWMIVRLLTRR